MRPVEIRAVQRNGTTEFEVMVDGALLPGRMTKDQAEDVRDRIQSGELEVAIFRAVRDGRLTASIVDQADDGLHIDKLFGPFPRGGPIKI